MDNSGLNFDFSSQTQYANKAKREFSFTRSSYQNDNKILSKINNVMKDNQKTSYDDSIYLNNDRKIIKTPICGINKRPVMSSLIEDNHSNLGNTFISSVKSLNNKQINLNTTVNDKHMTIKDKIDSLSNQLNITKLHSLDGVFNKKNQSTEELYNQRSQKNKEIKDFRLTEVKEEEKENTMLKHQMLIKRKVDDEVSEFSRELSWVPGQFKSKIASYNNYNYNKDKSLVFKPSPTTLDIFKSSNLTANKKNTLNFDKPVNAEKEDKFLKQKNRTTSISLNTTSEGNSKILTVEDVKILLVKLKLIHDPKSLDKSVVEEIKNLYASIKDIFTDDLK